MRYVHRQFGKSRVWHNRVCIAIVFEIQEVVEKVHAEKVRCLRGIPGNRGGAYEKTSIDSSARDPAIRSILLPIEGRWNILSR